MSTALEELLTALGEIIGEITSGDNLLLLMVISGAGILAAIIIYTTRKTGTIELEQEPEIIDAVEIKEEREEEEEKEEREKILEEYEVGELVKIRIKDLGGELLYEVEEPPLDERLRNIVEKLEDGYVRKGVDPEKAVKRYKLTEEEEKIVLYYVNRDLRGYWKMDPIMRDENLEDITITSPGPVKVVHRRYPDVGWITTNVTFTKEELDHQARLLAERCGGELSIAKPSAEVMTPEGDRVALTYAGELTPGSSTITIRKFPKSPYTIIDLIRFGTVSPLVAAYLWMMLEAKRFVLIAGPVGSGKTTLLASLLQLLPKNSKILTLEDYHPEINLSWHPNWHRFVTRRTLGETAYSLRDILRLSLRHRPDYVVVGEVRGEEAQVMFSAAATGHGMAATIHAESIEDVYERLTGASMNVPREDLNLLDVVAIIKVTKRGRRVINVWEIEEVGKEHLVAWYDEFQDRFFPTTAKQLSVNSPLLKVKKGLRENLEARERFLRRLAEEEKRFNAGELIRILEEERGKGDIVRAA